MSRTSGCVYGPLPGPVRPQRSARASGRGEIASAAPFLDEITKLSGVIRIQSSETLLRDATETALRIGHPVYDSLYIACARLTGSVLVTADRRLARVVLDHVPDVEVITLQDESAMARIEASGDSARYGPRQGRGVD